MKILNLYDGGWAANCYILIDEPSGECAIIDPSVDISRIETKIKELNLSVKYILLTHGHFDHMLTLEEVRNLTKAPVCIHKSDAPALTNPDISYFRHFAGTDTVFENAEILLSDNDDITLGKSHIKVMHTPGHTFGSVTYIIDDIMITGDTLFAGDIGRYDLYGGDYLELRKSLAKIASLEGDYRIFPGHGNSSRLSKEKKENIYLKQSDI